METARLALDLGQYHITECTRLLLPSVLCECVTSESSVSVHVGVDSPLQRAGLPLLQQQIQEVITAPAGEKQKHKMTTVFQELI